MLLDKFEGGTSLPSKGDTQKHPFWGGTLISTLCEGGCLEAPLLASRVPHTGKHTPCVSHDSPKGVRGQTQPQNSPPSLVRGVHSLDPREHVLVEHCIDVYVCMKNMYNSYIHMHTCTHVQLSKCSCAPVILKTLNQTRVNVDYDVN